MLSATGVGCRLPDGRQLFRHVDLSVQVGETVAIEGPSGTGKTTLLSILGGLEAPTSGTVVATVPSSGFAWVLQTLNALAARTVLDNARLQTVIDGERRAESELRAHSVLEQLGIGHLAAARARSLSGGELQRLGVARALVSRRPIVLADEPTNQLDAANARRVMRALVDAAHSEASKAVVIVTHDRSSLPAGVRVCHLDADGLHDAGSA